MLAEAIGKSGISVLNISGLVKKPLIPVLAKFKGFIENTARLYVIKPSSNAHDYSPDELSMFTTSVKDCLRRGVISTNKLSQLAIFATTDLATGKVSALTFVDMTVLESIPELATRLIQERILEIVM